MSFYLILSPFPLYWLINLHSHRFLATLSPNLITSINDVLQVTDVCCPSIPLQFQSSCENQNNNPPPEVQALFQNSDHELPNNLSEILSAMEESNLSLILNSQVNYLHSQRCLFI